MIRGQGREQVCAAKWLMGANDQQGINDIHHGQRP